MQAKEKRTNLSVLPEALEWHFPYILWLNFQSDFEKRVLVSWMFMHEGNEV